MLHKKFNEAHDIAVEIILSGLLHDPLAILLLRYFRSVILHRAYTGHLAETFADKYLHKSGRCGIGRLGFLEAILYVSDKASLCGKCPKIQHALKL
jgi:hypothetical protein